MKETEWSRNTMFESEQSKKAAATFQRIDKIERLPFMVYYLIDIGQCKVPRNSMLSP